MLIVVWVLGILLLASCAALFVVDMSAVDRERQEIIDRINRKLDS